MPSSDGVVTIASNSDQWRKISRWRVRDKLCSSAVAESQGNKEAFSTGSQNHQPPSPVRNRPTRNRGRSPPLMRSSQVVPSADKFWRRHHQTRRAVNSPAPRSPLPSNRHRPKVKQRWMKDKTGMLQHRIEIAAFDCWWKYPHEGIGPQHKQ